MKNYLLIPGYLLISLCIVSCGSAHYCYVVRHAEKLDNTPYSVLSAAGHARAGVLRDLLRDKKIDLVFATTFQRTQETAMPTADAFHQTMLIYRNNAVDSIATVIKSYRDKNILLVGHSGNLPAIIQNITGQAMKPIPENEYDNLYIIKMKKRKMSLKHEKF